MLKNLDDFEQSAYLRYQSVWIDREDSQVLSRHVLESTSPLL